MLFFSLISILLVSLRYLIFSAKEISFFFNQNSMMTKRFFQQKLLCRENENNVVKGMIIHVKIRESPKGDTIYIS